MLIPEMSIAKMVFIKNVIGLIAFNQNINS